MSTLETNRISVSNVSYDLQEKRHKLLDMTAEQIAYLCEGKGFYVPPHVEKPVVEHIPGALHRWDSNDISMVLVGPPRSGKTSLTHNLYAADAAKQRSGLLTTPDREVLDPPNQAKAILRVPFAGGFTVYDTPALFADGTTASNSTRAWLGLEQQGTPIAHITVVEGGEYQRVPVDHIKDQFSRGEAVVLFLVDLTMNPLCKGFQEELKADLQALREIYRNRLVVIGTFADELAQWDSEAQKQRRAIWQACIGEWIKYSAVTKQGLVEVVKRMLKESGCHTSDLIPSLTAEARGVRFQNALRQLSMTMAVCLGDTFSNTYPYADLQAKLAILSAMQLHLHYDSIGEYVNKDDWLRVNREADKILSQASEHGLALEIREYPKLDWELNFIQKCRTRFGKVYKEKFHSYWIDMPNLVNICLSHYRLLHNLQDIADPILEDEKARKWFTSQLNQRNVLEAIKELSELLPAIFEEVWISFFRSFHPSTLATQIHIAGENDEEVE